MYKTVQQNTEQLTKKKENEIELYSSALKQMNIA